MKAKYLLIFLFTLCSKQTLTAEPYYAQYLEAFIGMIDDSNLFNAFILLQYERISAEHMKNYIYDAIPRLESLREELVYLDYIYGLSKVLYSSKSWYDKHIKRLYYRLLYSRKERYGDTGLLIGVNNSIEIFKILQNYINRGCIKTIICHDSSNVYAPITVILRDILNPDGGRMNIVELKHVEQLLNLIDFDDKESLKVLDEVVEDENESFEKKKKLMREFNEMFKNYIHPVIMNIKKAYSMLFTLRKNIQYVDERTKRLANRGLAKYAKDLETFLLSPNNSVISLGSVYKDGSILLDSNGKKFDTNELLIDYKNLTDICNILESETKSMRDTDKEISNKTKKQKLLNFIRKFIAPIDEEIKKTTKNIVATIDFGFFLLKADVFDMHLPEFFYITNNNNENSNEKMKKSLRDSINDLKRFFCALKSIEKDVLESKKNKYKAQYNSEKVFLNYMNQFLNNNEILKKLYDSYNPGKEVSKDIIYPIFLTKYLDVEVRYCEKHCSFGFLKEIFDLQEAYLKCVCCDENLSNEQKKHVLDLIFTNFFLNLHDFANLYVENMSLYFQKYDDLDNDILLSYDFLKLIKFFESIYSFFLLNCEIYLNELEKTYQRLIMDLSNLHKTILKEPEGVESKSYREFPIHQVFCDTKKHLRKTKRTFNKYIDEKNKKYLNYSLIEKDSKEIQHIDEDIKGLQKHFTVEIFQMQNEFEKIFADLFLMRKNNKKKRIENDATRNTMDQSEKHENLNINKQGTPDSFEHLPDFKDAAEINESKPNDVPSTHSIQKEDSIEIVNENENLKSIPSESKIDSEGSIKTDDSSSPQLSEESEDRAELKSDFVNTNINNEINSESHTDKTKSATIKKPNYSLPTNDKSDKEKKSYHISLILIFIIAIVLSMCVLAFIIIKSRRKMDT